MVVAVDVQRPRLGRHLHRDQAALPDVRALHQDLGALERLGHRFLRLRGQTWAVRRTWERQREIFMSGATSGITTVTGMPSLVPWNESASAWFPADAAT